MQRWFIRQLVNIMVVQKVIDCNVDKVSQSSKYMRILWFLLVVELLAILAE